MDVNIVVVLVLTRVVELEDCNLQFGSKSCLLTQYQPSTFWAANFNSTKVLRRLDSRSVSFCQIQGVKPFQKK